MDRYTLGKEIGRGGLGRVVEATDQAVGRPVALKLLLEGAPLEIVERFRREGRLTGRLQHPNIIPVYDLGTLAKTGGSAEVFFAMKRITGRDMGEVIRRMAAGRPEGWTLRRLVEAFLSVCHAVAYAHAQGVVHRDIKPDNVMLGEFGEVLLVDWGLARLATDPPDQGISKAGAPRLTLDGEVVGTPAYMSPEQAEGKDTDSRSDVYALGAVLYEILTWRAPHEGDSCEAVLAHVRSGIVTPPSRILLSVIGGAVPSPHDVARPQDVPPELEAICMKALSRDPADRFPGAADLASEIAAFLEGTRERERREQLAAAEVARARTLIEEWKTLGDQGAAVLEKANEAARNTRRHSGLDGHRPLWVMEDEAIRLQKASLRAFTDADAALAAALSLVPSQKEARRLKADLYWFRFRQAEEADDESLMHLHRAIVEQYNDGDFDAALKGDGVLSVETRAYGCACLREGRTVEPAELNVNAFHPWSGKRMDGVASEFSAEGETPSAVRARVHTQACRAEPVAGARAWAFRFESIDRLWMPVTPGPSETPIPEALLDRLYGDSPYRPRGGGLFLGTTPIANRPWPMGSWLLILDAPGFAPARSLFHVARQQTRAVRTNLYRPDEIPAACLPVTSAPFQFHRDIAVAPDEGGILIDPEDAFVGRFPVTNADYLEFLEALAPAEADARVPRRAEQAEPYWRRDAAGRWTLAGAPRLKDAAADWHPAWPVFGISWHDALAFARWRSRRDGFVFTLPDDILWEKSARGPDGRTFPWGDRHCDAFANTNDSLPGGMSPVPVTDFPTDESPWGVRGMGGNGQEWSLALLGPSQPSWRALRGGRWSSSARAARSSLRAGFNTRTVFNSVGFRLVAPARLTAAGTSAEVIWRKGPAQRLQV